MGWQYQWNKKEKLRLASHVTKDAAQFLPKISEDRFALVQDKDKRVDLVRLIYERMSSCSISYVPPKSSTDSVQEIRPPWEIIFTGQREGTCLDIVLTFCGVCLHCDLRPVVVMFSGHVIAAVNLDHNALQDGEGESDILIFSDDSVLTDPASMTHFVNMCRPPTADLPGGSYLPIECLGLARSMEFDKGEAPQAIGRGPDGLFSFDRAIQAGFEQFEQIANEEGEDEHRTGSPFLYAVDIVGVQKNNPRQ